MIFALLLLIFSTLIFVISKSVYISFSLFLICSFVGLDKFSVLNSPKLLFLIILFKLILDVKLTTTSPLKISFLLKLIFAYVEVIFLTSKSFILFFKSVFFSFNLSLICCSVGKFKPLVLIEPNSMFLIIYFTGLLYLIFNSPL
ncbi:hypothetical protein SMSRO_SF020480 [Spiroplasma poulsonii]|uniref:Uncharacterized protein n=1 Tax=Spiroplasma poulsonii TaxID=2138 RepID=A0A2P6FEJ6_9MOLU|nr:hypothetical protein SMSRO_SF017340 [Spiroplasma poulsonii]PQM32148.1 hypothetical protein SMSRO_SF020480 [Spiroplasma poulsonii]PWF94339.1 hypothetical protein SMH99_23230 [Spiroplasma poulsonii]PWF94793.1 hypothetical protein SMSE_02170 [Spiroplasma poulsonii]PWF96911.1 hypothetical protein SMSE_23580 [Spiroplasma poulsonii]